MALEEVMRDEQKAALESLRQRGWQVRLHDRPKLLPQEIQRRYPWLPAEIREFMEATADVISPDDKAWFVTTSDLLGRDGSAYAWNEWELDSLAAAVDDADWQGTIRAFWERHMPVMMSLKSCYAYFAVRMEDLAVVHGEEPEYEETSDFAPSFSAFLRMVQDSDPRLSLWV
jgi:hypothetical protein